MICSICKKGETSVVDSRPTEDGTAIRRRRLCVCGARFTTFERVQYRELMVVKKNGRKFWYINGIKHRDDGPAVIDACGTEEWCRNGKYHREDGPAVIYPDGRKGWYLNGKKYSLNDWIKLLNITDEEKMELILYYG